MADKQGNLLMQPRPVRIQTNNLEPLIEFYLNDLECLLLGETALGIELLLGDCRIAIERANTGVSDNHVSIDLVITGGKTLMKELEAAGIEVEHVGEGEVDIFVVRDPDGNQIRFRDHAASMGQIERINSPTFGVADGGLSLFCTVRNEELRLPFFLQYYRSLGVSRFFMIDNDSTDRTQELLLGAGDVCAFRTDDHFGNQSLWIERLLRQYGLGQWCVIVDADELLVYPRIEEVSLDKLCSFFDLQGFNAMQTVLLDMYPASSLNQSAYATGDDFRKAARWFDATGIIWQPWPDAYPNQYAPKHAPFGGVRKRVFGITPCLSKFPLVRYDGELVLSAGTHFIVNARVAPMRGASLHFKFLHDFVGRALEEASRGVHYNGASEYRAYRDVISSMPNISLWDERSVQLENSEHLVRLGVMLDCGSDDVMTER